MMNALNQLQFDAKSLQRCAAASNMDNEACWLVQYYAVELVSKFMAMMQMHACINAINNEHESHEQQIEENAQSNQHANGAHQQC